MATTLQHWIDGALSAGTSGRFSDVTDPATGEVTGRLPLASSDEVDAAVAAATTAFPGWRDTSLTKRTQVLFAFRELLNARKGELAQIVTSEHGKVLSDALGEVSRGQEVVEFACGVAHLMKGSATENASTGVDVRSIRQPLGAVAIISPFNFPAMVPMWFFPIAIATGNAVVLKPSEKVPTAALWMAELWKEAGLPRRRLQRPERRQGRGRRAADAPGHRIGVLRGLHADRALRLRDRHRPWEAGAGARRGEEPHGRAPGRRPRPRRRPGRERRLRLRGRAVHGDLRGGGRRGRRRRPRRQDPAAGGGAAHRGRPPQLRHGPARHGGRTGPGLGVHRRRRGRRRHPRRGRPQGRGGRRGRGVLRRPDAVRPRRHRHDDLHRRDLRPRAVGRAGGDLRRGRRAGQRQPVRQRDRDLHQRRRRSPALRERGAGRA